MSAAASNDPLPFHLRGNFAPVADEATLGELRVEGALPSELRGLYVRNGPNPRSGASPHWFLGDGMVHGVRLEAGRALSFRNRYVRTRRLADPDAPRVSPEGRFDYTLSAANTHVLGHAGRIWALEEGSFPYFLDGELNTTGWSDFGGKLKCAFTAHPKQCPVTGELLAFGYSPFAPFFTFHRVSKTGELLESTPIETKGPSMMHDFAITQSRILIPDLSIVFDLGRAMQDGMPYQFDESYGARVGVLPRDGAGPVRWFEIEPCFFFHVVNAWDEGDRVVMDACRYASLWREAGSFAAGGGQTLHRWTFDLASGAVKEETLDERASEFPRVADARVGQKHRFSYLTLATVGGPESPRLEGLLKLDAVTGKSEEHRFGPQRCPGEPVFVPAAGSRSDEEGYVLSYVHDLASATTELVVLDASRFSAPPLARVQIPRRVPFGFHGSWIAGA
jgi:carotenoid cleavage dioxygenase-like enzyme